MLRPAAQPITALYQTHLDEIQNFLCRRPQILRSANYNPCSVRLFDARLEAHIDALVVAGAAATPYVLEALDMDTELAAAAAGLVLARAEERGIDLRPLFQKIPDASPDVLAGLRTALVFSPRNRTRAHLMELLAHGDARTGAFVIDVLAAHDEAVEMATLVELTLQPDPAVRTAVWNAVAGVTWGGKVCEPLRKLWGWQKPLEAALEDSDPTMQTAALTASVMTRQPYLLPWLRAKAAAATRAELPALDFFAALSEARDLPLFVGLLERRSLGLQRFSLVARFGHPGLVEPLLAHMASADAAESVAAALAFHLMTGIEVPSDGLVKLPSDWLDEPEDADPEALEEVPHPHAAAARQRWNEIRGQFGNALRLYRGVDIGAPDLAAPATVAFDMQTYGHAFLRASFRGEGTTQFLDFWRRLQPVE
jgi:hypothetical protein